MSSSLDHINNTSISKAEFIYHYQRLLEKEDRLEYVFAAMGWTSNTEELDEFNTAFSADHFVIASNALHFLLGNELLHLVACSKAHRQLYMELWPTLVAFKEHCDMALATSVSGDSELAEAQSEAAGTTAEALHMQLSDLPEEALPFYTELVNDILANLYNAVDASSECMDDDGDAEDEDTD